jgi:YidC/Oxa1 family membrane protein insertase
MEFLSVIFNTVLYRPIFNALVLLYEFLPGRDFGVAIIVLTVIVRILLYPSTVKSIKSQRALQDLQPKIKEIQSKIKDKTEQGKAMMELYSKEKISPLSGCLPILFQLPLLIALFLVLKAIAENSGSLDPGLFYSFVHFSGEINAMFLGVLNLANPNPVLALVAGITQFFQSKTMTLNANPGQEKGKKGDFSQMMQKQMLYFFPVMTFFILLRLPSAIALYWITTALFSVGQQYLAFKGK